MKIDFSRPDTIFLIVWLLVLAIYVPIPSIVTPPLSVGVAAMLAFNMLSAPVIYWLVRKNIEKKYGARPQITHPRLSLSDQHILSEFLVILMIVWVAIFVAGVVYSRGLPLQWYLTGDKRDYTDFGIPTISGLGEMLCGFGSVLCILLFLTTRRHVFILLWTLHLLPNVLEVSRGGIFFFVMQSVAVVLLVQKLKLRQLFATALVFGFAISMFVVLGSLRGIKTASTDFEGVSDFLGDMPVGVFWAWSYIATPLGNVVHAVSVTTWHPHFPTFSLVYLLPSFIRLGFTKEQVYTPLATEGFNATSIYAPLFMDFGLVGAALLVALLIIIASYVHVMARRGQLFYIALYPVLYASVALSFFHIFALTPSVVTVPFVCIWMRNFIKRKQGMAREASQRALATMPGLAGE